jgi:hypothetical protein
MVDVPGKPAAPGSAYAIDLPLAGLANGEYLLEIKAAAERKPRAS